MNTKLTIAISVLTQLLFAGLKTAGQTPKIVPDSLNIGDVCAYMYSDGTSFWNPTTGMQEYRVPKTGKASSIFSAAMWIGGLDAGRKLHIAAMTYNQNGYDFWPGPMMDSINYSPHQDTIWNHVWKVNKSTVDSFSHGLCHTIPASIANWPGNGNIALGEAPILAPYVDIDGNGVYDPSGGDYPSIRGDQALYMIYNDDRGPAHAETGGLKLGIEVHLMAYAFNTPNDSPVNQTVFLHYDVINRSHNTYDSVYMGYFCDMDLGNGANDYVGCDSANNYWYTYNGTATDPNGTGNFLGEIGYGGPTPPPPAQGVAYLCDTMTHFQYYANDFTVTGNPVDTSGQPIDTDYYRYMESIWKDGKHVTYGGSGYQSSATKTNYMFSGNPATRVGWSMVTASIAPNDMRGLSSVGPFTFAAGTHKSQDIALVFARPDTGTNISSVTQLGLNVAHVRSFYTSQNYGCDENLAGVTNIQKDDEVSASLYPNPMQTSSALVVNSELKNAQLKLYDVLGREVMNIQNISGKRVIINRNNLQAGMYFYRLIDNGQPLVNGKLLVE